MSVTDQCSRCGGDCPMTRCLECGGCENTGPGGTFRDCPACQPANGYGCPDCGRGDCTGEDCYWPDEAGLR